MTLTRVDISKGSRIFAVAFSVLALLAGVFGVLAPGSAAHAESSPIRSASNPFYVYLKSGDYLYVNSAALGNVRDETTAIAAPSAPDLYGPAVSDGVWQVDIGQVNNAPSMRPWEITARTSDGVDIPGRVWSTLVGTHQSSTSNLQYWVVNDTGYLYQVVFNGYHGIESRIRADAIGNPVLKGECIPSYQSKQSDGSDNGWDRIPDCGSPYRIFFDEPAADLPATARLGTEQIPVLPDPVLVSDLAVTDLAFAPVSRSSATGVFTWSLTDRFVGSYWLEVDVDRDGAYDGARDVRVQQFADGSGVYDYAFAGRDGLGDPIADCTSMRARIYFDKIGEVHFVQDDVEGRAGGIEVTRLTGPASPDPTLYWNDALLTGTRANTTTVLDGSAGVDSTGGVHGWGFDHNSWGNNRVIEDWTFTPIGQAVGEIEFGSSCLNIQKTSDATADTRVGDVVNYTVTATNIGSEDFTIASPAVVLDNLAGVLDDASYNGDGTANRAGTVSFASPLLSWTGPLTVGESVELSYSVTLESGGDGIVRNVVWEPEDPENPEPPLCDSPVGGVDAQSGERCAEVEHLLPKLAVDKSASPESGSTVVAGQEVTYTLTFSNTGEASGSVDYTDSLAAVLDDANLTGAPISSDPALVVTDGAEGLIRVTGTLAPEQVATISYTVTVKPDGHRGDNRLRNMVAESSTANPQCGDDGVKCTEHTIGELDDWKTVEPAIGSTLRPGETATYTLHFENTGQAPVAVNRDDILSEVFDDADITAQPTASSDAVSVSAIENGRFTIAGTLQPGQVVTVTYAVTVKADGQRGNDRLDNFLVPNGEEPPGACEPTDGERPDCTYNHVSDVSVTKSSDPKSGTTVDPGEEVTYTLTFTNRGTDPEATDLIIDYTDHMADVLDDAALTAGPAVSNKNLTATAEGDTIRISGALPTGEVYTVTYSVKVNAYDKQGNHHLGNVVAITGEKPMCVADSPLCTDHKLPKPPGGLAHTGTEVPATVILAMLLLLGAGGGLLLFGRRRARTTTREAASQDARINDLL